MHRPLLAALILLTGLGPFSSPGPAQDLEAIFEERNLEPVKQLLARGDYELCHRIGLLAKERGLRSVEWRLIHLSAMQALGLHEEALTETETMLTQFPKELRLWMQQHDIAQQLGRQQAHQNALQQINQLARQIPAAQRSAEDWVILGRAALAAGADPQKVIQQYFQTAQKKDPKLAAAYLAEGHLALDKYDPARAANLFRAGLKNHGETAELRHGLALAFLDSDRAATDENLKRALEINPHHSPSLLLRARLLIQAERFFDAEAQIYQVLSLDEKHPEAWALRAAISGITTADEAALEKARSSALQRWPTNPLVDHTIGTLLSRAYRFTEGARFQRRALQFSPSHLPAKHQLSLDLLKLGEEKQAFELAEAVRQQDPYNVQAFNLSKLETQLRGFYEHQSPHFTLKMPAREWPVYGARALEILEQAHQTLSARYPFPMPRRTLVEFFPSRQDFAMRTLGNLGGQGILGACFGSVVTMNSPGSLAHGRNNWEATLWHEFTHVVTLTATQNRMPRWLSEGISVFEEQRQNPAWGMTMTADYRRMILSEESTPLSQLSQAFLSAASSEHLMFAYFQAGRAVAFIHDNYGHPALLKLMDALLQGQRINDAIEATIAPLADLEQAFSRHLHDAATAFGAKADWEEPEPEDLNPTDPDSLRDYLSRHPNNLWALNLQLRQAQINKDWPQVIQLADQLIKLIPDDTANSGPWQAKAQAHRQLEQSDLELTTLNQWVEKRADALTAMLRLIELQQEKQNWPQVITHAQSVLALNPFLRQPNQALAKAAQESGQNQIAIQACQRLLALDPPNSAQIHHQLALLQLENNPQAARRHLLDALAEAPRFLAAHRLLQQLPPSPAPQP